jgi:NADH:ubiquinone oxidoreductase subunit 6 (subunit J)
MLDYLTRYFVGLSAIVVVAAAAVSMLFLTAYLTVFDWNLVWLVEYSDLAKFGLMAVAIISPLLAMLGNQLDAFYKWVALKQKEYRKLVWFLVAIVFFGAAFSIYMDIQHKSGLATHHLMNAVSILIAFSLMWLAFGGSDAWRNRDWSAIFNHTVLIALSLGFFGGTYGFYVKDASKQRSEITTKNETFKAVKIVMMLSHHIVFLSDGKVITVPAGDLVKIVSEILPSNLLP